MLFIHQVVFELLFPSYNKLCLFSNLNKFDWNTVPYLSQNCFNNVNRDLLVVTRLLQDCYTKLKSRGRNSVVIS